MDRNFFQMSPLVTKSTGSLDDIGTYLEPEADRIWIEVGDKCRQEEILALLDFVAQAAAGKLVRCDSPGNDYRAHGSLSELITKILPIVEKEAPSLLTNYRSALEQVYLPFAPHGESRRSSSADAVAYAIVRRISRESASFAHRIDQVARFLIDAKRACASLAGPLLIAIPDCDICDRPSLRVFYRAQRLGRRSDGITWYFLFNRIPASPCEGRLPVYDIETRLRRARYLLFSRLAEELRAHKVRLTSHDDPPAISTAALSSGSLEEIADSLVRHNYERVYQLVGAALPSTEADTRADILRLLALADANLGDIESALTTLQESLTHCRRATLRAHLHYLIGLLYTKRFYQLDEAEAAYRLGIACLDGQPDAEQVHLERSWLLNGIALVNSLRAKSSPPDQRTATLEQIMRDEIAAYKIVEDQNDSGSIYLRFNLLTNIAFLLEIQERYDDAIRFWDRAFDRYLDDPSDAGRGFQKVFYYRKAMLLERERKPEVAVETLLKALTLAREGGDRFGEERIVYGLAYAYWRCHEFNKALEWFSFGTNLALNNRDRRLALEHAAGALQAAAALGHTSALRRVAETALALQDGAPWRTVLDGLARTENPLELSQLLTELKITVRPPSPKLPAYIPSVDLEAEPAVDLNRYLVTRDAEPLSQVVARTRRDPA